MILGRKAVSTVTKLALVICCASSFDFQYVLVGMSVHQKQLRGQRACTSHISKVWFTANARRSVQQNSSEDSEAEM